MFHTDFGKIATLRQILPISIRNISLAVIKTKNTEVYFSAVTFFLILKKMVVICEEMGSDFVCNVVGTEGV